MQEGKQFLAQFNVNHASAEDLVNLYYNLCLHPDFENISLEDKTRFFTIVRDYHTIMEAKDKQLLHDEYKAIVKGWLQ
jgi:hypothetical protein